MPSTTPERRKAVTAVVGVVLLAATVLAPFGAVAWTYEYNAEQVTADDPHLASELGWPDETATCFRDLGGCSLAYRVKGDGSRIVSDTEYRAASGFGGEKRLVVFPDSSPAFYQPTVTRYENDTTRVALTSVSNATALELASTPAHRFPSGVQRIVADETVRTSRPLSGFELWGHTGAVVAHDGSYYQRGSYTYRGSMEGIADFLRLGVLAVGAALCYRAGRVG